MRNSIILMDFIELRIRQGMPLDQAVIDVGAVRLRPMMLKATAVVVGVSLLFSQMTVSILYFLDKRWESSHLHHYATEEKLSKIGLRRYIESWGISSFLMGLIR